MKWFAAASLAALALMSVPACAQNLTVLPIGRIPILNDRGPAVWAIAGFEIVHVRAGKNGRDPVSRTLVWDARNVEILSRTQSPPLRRTDTRVVNRNGHTYVTVRKYVLLEVTPEDARAERTSVRSLANRWADRVRQVLPQIAPYPNRFGV